MAEVAKRLPTDDPVETANNLTNFKLMGRSAREAVQTSAVGAFHARLNRLGMSAKALNSLDLPEADDRAYAFAPTIKFQSPARKSAIVDEYSNCLIMRKLRRSPA
ncbi:hypothetical protein AJ87_49010 [Rhizobium yanglingense]|nr:hypothetical protein AJ87_49010 [Rhizobium yanglingense]